MAEIKTSGSIHRIFNCNESKLKLMQVDYNSLFTLLSTEKEIEVLNNPYVNACLSDVMAQLEAHGIRQGDPGPAFFSPALLRFAG